MGGFAGITPASPAPPPSPQEPSEQDLAAQVARINADAMAEPAEAPAKPGGFFARFIRGREKAPEPPPQEPSTISDAAFGDASMGEESMTDASMGEEAMAEAGVGEGVGASMGETSMGLDAGLAEQAFPGEKPPRQKPSIVTIGWLVLALVVAVVIGTLAFAPSAVTSILPGASRLYALFGVSVGAQGLDFEDVRYTWTNNGGQTVLQVEGNVVKLTSSARTVPTLTIALHDADDEEISAWTTEIGAEQLGAGERAPFLRQISSPPSNVSSVKVHFAKAE
jgi:hypothetical protein